MRPLACVLSTAVALVGSAASVDARAFTISSPVTDGCHEEITEAALGRVRTRLATAAPVTPDREERTLVDDLPFDLPSDMRDVTAASLLVGVRDNDLEGRSPTDLDQLALVHGDPRTQEKHCLRNASDDEPNGSSEALERCRAFIHARAMEAVDALDGRGFPDPDVREHLDVSLAIRGRVDVSLPAYWIRIGQAMHALEDGFAHTYRTDDGLRVTVVLNWVDLVNQTDVPSRDGPPHKMDLDQCNAGDRIRSRNKALATDAAEALLEATLDPSLSRDDKAAAVDAVLEKYLSYEPGCTHENGWCHAPEDAYTNPSACACGVAGDPDAAAGGLAIAAGALALVLARRRRRRLSPAALALLAAFGVARTASAQEAPSTEDPNAPIPPRTVGEVQQAVKERRHHESPVALSAAFAGSIVDPAIAGSVGLRFRVSRAFLLGVDGEANGWYGVGNHRFALGAASVYATGIIRYPMRFEPVNLRTTLHAGVADEVLDLYGVPHGSVGPFLGVYPLGVEWKASGHVFLVLNPLGVALPITRVSGTPFVVPQFRSQLGLEIAL